VLGDPVNLVDPSGEFWNFIIGAAISVVFEVYDEYKKGTLGLNWRTAGRIGYAALTGAWGGFAGKLSGAIIRGALSGMANNTYQQLDSCNKWDWGAFVGSGVGGAIGGAFGDVGEKIGKSILKDPLRRSIRNTIIPGAYSKLPNYGLTGAVIGGVSGSYMGNSVGQKIDNKW